MVRKTAKLVGTGIFAAAAAASSNRSMAQTIDGSLSAGDGYQLVSTQTNATDSNNDPNGGDNGPASNANTSTPRGQFTNFSNAYASIDASSNLNLFVGGSIEETTDSKYAIAIQVGSGGISGTLGSADNDINGAGTSGDIYKFGFSSNKGANAFKPTGLFIVYPGNTVGTGTIDLSGTTNTTEGANGAFGGVSYTDLFPSGGAAHGNVTSTTTVLNNALLTTPVGAGKTNDPGFAGAKTGLEMQFSLISLGYTPGTDVKIFVFDLVGNDTRTNNQVLSPFTYADTNGYDYSYVDSNNSVNSDPLRQFDQGVYAGQGYFDVPGFVAPEPTSLGLLVFGAIPMLRRRSRKQSA